MNSLANPRVCGALAACGLLVGFSVSAAVVAPASSLLPDKAIAALANEVSGDTAKTNLESAVQFHRQRASKGFHSAAELIGERARAYGLDDAQILRFPADGKIFLAPSDRARPGTPNRPMSLPDWSMWARAPRRPITRART